MVLQRSQPEYCPRRNRCQALACQRQGEASCESNRQALEDMPCQSLPHPVSPSPPDRWAHSDGIRVRTVVSPARATAVRGKYPSAKSNRSVHWDSQLERAVCHRAELDPSIAWFREQPLTLRYRDRDDNKLRRYTPDFEFRMRDGRILIVEVKPLKRLLSESRRFLTIHQELAAAGYEFVAVTDENFSDRHTNENISLLAQYSGLYEDACAFYQSQRQELRKAETFRELHNHCGLKLAYALIAHGFVDIDLHTSLSDHAWVNATMGECYDNFNISYRSAVDHWQRAIPDPSTHGNCVQFATRGNARANNPQ